MMEGPMGICSQQHPNDKSQPLRFNQRTNLVQQLPGVSY